MIIAEIGHNHNGNMKLAKELIWKAKECGADIAKFQIYNVDTIFEPTNPLYWEIKAVQLTYPQVKMLYKECKKADIEFLASVFDHRLVKWTEKIGMERYKLASRSVNDSKLVKAVESTGKPIIASLGMWDKPDFPDIKGEVDYLYCIAKYPAIDSDFKDFPEKFYKLAVNKYTGFSDHSIGLKWCKLAVDRGARIIEKHFTLDVNMPGYDQKGSMEPAGLAELVKYSAYK